MDSDALLDYAERATERLIDLASAGDLDMPVPSCPAWAMRDLVAHVATRPEIWLTFAALGPGADPDMDALQRLFVGEPPRPDPELFDWVREEHRRFRAATVALGMQHPIWFFERDLTVAYLAERAALEMAIHSWDAEATHGQPAPVDSVVAGLGIDEHITVSFPIRASWGPGPTLDTIMLRATDTSRAWTLTASNGNVHVDPDAPPTATITGTASDLYLATWNRVPLDRFNVEGDSRLAQGWLDFFAEAG